MRIIQKTEPDSTKLITKAILSLYLITWIFGASAVQSFNANSVIRDYIDYRNSKTEELSKSLPRQWTSQPAEKTYLSFPVLPFIVVSGHYYSIHSMAGRLGIDAYLWYGVGVKKLFGITLANI